MTNYEKAKNSDIIKVILKNYKSIGEILEYIQSRGENYYKMPIFKERSLSYDDNYLLSLKDVYFWGYWQSEKYFKSIEGILRKEISLINKLDVQNAELAKLIANSESVCVHIRNGDYFYDEKIRNNIGILPIEYYYIAIDCILREVNNPHFYIFSNNIKWVNENFKIKQPHTIISNNSEKSHLDLYLMSQCKHFITANSSFSWWGAWLSDAKNKIVYTPNPWCKNPLYNPVDIHPSNWKKISVNLL
ncbi:MAG: alpha-1,2-fucosyltransferase [Ignavibacteriales bacterium]|nr:alpha-1,2-fucosyltransferase [Ignavibacteriales bacterium]